MMQNVRLAGFAKRFVAYIIDRIIVLVGFFSIGYMCYHSIESIRESFKDLNDITSTPNPLIDIVSFLIGASFLFFLLLSPIIYEVLLTASSFQATLGKRIMRIKVVKENGQTLSKQEALGRTLLKALTSLFCFLLFLVCTFDKKDQNLHDRAVNTLVIEE